MIPPARTNFLTRALLRFSIAVAVAMAAAMTAGAGTAMAQDQSTIDRLVQLNKKAMDDYDTADFDTAKKSLLDAERLGKRSGLEGHPVMARTYIHLGALYLLGFKDKQKAQHYFGKALDIQPDIRLDKNLTSASVRDLFASVQAQKGGGAATADDDAAAPPPPPPPSRKGRVRPDVAAPPAAEGETPAPSAPAARRAPRRDAPVESGDADEDPDLPATVTALDCPYPDDTPPGKKVTLRCAGAANLGIAGVTLFYKGYKMSNYESVAMSRSPKGWWQTAIPKKRVDGTSLQFYFEGLDASDKPVVSNGRAESPNVMLIVERANEAKLNARSDEEENPLEEKSGAAPKLLLGKYDSSRLGVDKRFGNRRFWIGLGLGTGFVYAINGVVESRVSGNVLPGGGPSDLAPITGGGWAGLGQLAPEIGFQITPDWAVSIEGRDQWIPQSAAVAGYTASGAHAVLLKLIRYTKQQRFRLFFAADAGGGEGARMNIATDPSKPELKDTILVGPVLVGGTAGVTYEISKKFSWIAELNVLASVASHKGIVFDFNSGIQMNFGDTSGAAEIARKKRAESVSGSIDDEDPQ